MREIKFRGRHYADGQYYQGDLIQTMNNGKLVPMIETEDNAYYVDPDTVGQFTGMTDGTGTEIYENDMLKLSDGFTGTVVYSDSVAAFVLASMRPRMTLPLTEVMCLGAKRTGIKEPIAKESSWN